MHLHVGPQKVSVSLPCRLVEVKSTYQIPKFIIRHRSYP